MSVPTRATQTGESWRGPWRMLRDSRPFLWCEAKVVVADRGLLFVDTVLATLLPLVVYAVLWGAVFSGDGDAQLAGYGYQQLITYFIYAIALGRLNNGYDIVDRLSHSVLEGTLEAHVVRPVPFPLQLLVGFLGGSVVYLALVGVSFVADMFMRGGQLPLAGVDLIVHIVIVAVVLLCSQLLLFMISFCIGLATFGLKRTDLLLSGLLLAQTTLGGLLLPPDMWSGPLAVIMQYNPFRYLIATPAEVLSSWQTDAAVSAIVPGLCYLVFFSLLAAWLWKRALTSYHGAGG